MATKTSHRRRRAHETRKAAEALRQLNAEAAQLLDAHTGKAVKR